MKVAQLHETIDDTTLAVGSDAYSTALDVYTYAKAARVGANLDELKSMMAKRFAPRRKTKAATMKDAA